MKNLTDLCIDRDPEVIWGPHAELSECYRSENLANHKPTRTNKQSKALSSEIVHLQTVRVDVETSQLSRGDLGQIERHGGLKHTNTHSREELSCQPMFPSCRK